MATLLSTLTPLIAALKADGYTVIGPAQRDGAIVLTELSSAEDLARGWGVTVEAGTYRLRRRNDTLAFGHSVGPQSCKTYLHPSKIPLWTVRRADSPSISPSPSPRPMTCATPSSGYAPAVCAIAIQYRVLARPGSHYAQRRAAAFIVAVNCTEPGETCFCVAAGAGRPAGPAPT